MANIYQGRKFFQVSGITKANYFDSANYHVITRPDVLVRVAILLTDAGTSSSSPLGSVIYATTENALDNPDYWATDRVLSFTPTRTPIEPAVSLTEPVYVDIDNGVANYVAIGFMPNESDTVFAMLVEEFLPPERYKFINAETILTI